MIENLKLIHLGSVISEILEIEDNPNRGYVLLIMDKNEFDPSIDANFTSNVQVPDIPALLHSVAYDMEQKLKSNDLEHFVTENTRTKQ